MVFLQTSGPCNTLICTQIIKWMKFQKQHFKKMKKKKKQAVAESQKLLTSLFPGAFPPVFVS